MPLRAIDLFCGAGGFALGMKRAGFEIIKSLDYDPAAVAVHRANLGDDRIDRPTRLCQPLPPTHIYEEEPVAPQRDHIARDPRVHMIADLGAVTANAPDIAALKPDIIFGGPPCQPYSKAGDGLGDYDPRSALTDAFAATVACAHPRYFVMENVDGVRRSKAYKRSMAMLRHHGYGLTETLLDGSYYGNAQKRKRWICAGCLGESDGWLLEYLEQYKSPRQLTVRDVLGPDFGTLLADCLVDQPAPMPKGGHHELRERDRTVLESSPEDMPLYFCRPGGEKSAGICRVDQPCPTITGKSTQGIGMNYLPYPDDPIDLRKLAHPTFEQFVLLAGYPQDWQWDVPVRFKRTKDGSLAKAERITGTQIRQMLGNSVAPSLAECIGRAIVDHERGEEAGYPSSKSPEAANEPIARMPPTPVEVPQAYRAWLRRELGLEGRTLSQEISNLKRVRRYVMGRRLASAMEEFQALELAPPPAFRKLASANRATLRRVLQTYAEWEEMDRATKRMRRIAAASRAEYRQHLQWEEDTREERERQRANTERFFERMRQRRSA
jgi:site-specific DNA-cytosine methylase